MYLGLSVSGGCIHFVLQLFRPGRGFDHLVTLAWSFQFCPDTGLKMKYGWFLIEMSKVPILYISRTVCCMNFVGTSF